MRIVRMDHSRFSFSSAIVPGRMLFFKKKNR